MIDNSIFYFLKKISAKHVNNENIQLWASSTVNPVSLKLKSHIFEFQVHQFILTQNFATFSCPQLSNGENFNNSCSWWSCQHLLILIWDAHESCRLFLINRKSFILIDSFRTLGKCSKHSYPLAPMEVLLNHRKSMNLICDCTKAVQENYSSKRSHDLAFE